MVRDISLTEEFLLSSGMVPDLNEEKDRMHFCCGVQQQLHLTGLSEWPGAARGIINRRGVGKVRHLSCRSLWLRTYGRWLIGR